MTLPRRFEVRPKNTKNIIEMAIICSVFVLGGFFIMPMGVKEFFVGLLSIIFFGGGGLFAILETANRPVSIILTTNSLRQVFPAGYAIIAWHDIECIGTIYIYGNEMVGLCLKTYDNYINNLSPKLAAQMAKPIPYLKFLPIISFLLPTPLAVKLSCIIEGRENPNQMLASLGKIKTIKESIHWNRDKFGYDICFSSYDLDRPAEEFVQLLEQYRLEARYKY